MNQRQIIFPSVIIIIIGLVVSFKVVIKYQNKNIFFEDSSGKVLSKKDYEELKNDTSKIYISTRKDSVGKVIYTLYTENDIAENKHSEIAEVYYNEIVNKPFPSFKHKDITNREFTENSFKGNATVYTFWFTKCKPCINEIPTLNKLKNKLTNVNFVSMTFETKQILSQFLEGKAFDFVNLYDTMELNKKLKINAYPLHIIVNKNGKIKGVVSGYLVGKLELKIRETIKSLETSNNI